MTSAQGELTTTSTFPVPRLAIDSMSMTFGNTTVLHDVSMAIQPGEIHALIGQNGSGKSTLASILAGLNTPDEGTSVAVDGNQLRLPVRLQESRERGVAVVHQSLGLIDGESVLANLRIGRLHASGLMRRINWKREREQADAIFARLGRSVPLDAKVGTLREDERATVAIARALQDAKDGSGLIIFDESTRALGRRSLEHFFQILDEIVQTGTSVLMVTHRLEEVIDAADRVTVLRDGYVVEANHEVAGMKEADLASLMLGRLVIDLGQPAAKQPTNPGKSIAAQSISGLGVRNVSLTVSPGEVLGLTGIAGSGFEDVPYLLSGVVPAQSGTLGLPEGELKLTGLSPASAIEAGIALIPEGREHSGLASNLTASENAVLPRTSRAKNGFAKLPSKSEALVVEEWMERLDVRPRRPKALVKTFSGGNQQKILVAKWLSTQPTLFLLHEPTQAVDVGARATIVNAIRQAADDGAAVIVAGSDENELAMLCDRILVFDDGVVRTELREDLSPDAIVHATYEGGSRTRLRQRLHAGAGRVASIPTDSTNKQRN